MPDYLRHSHEHIKICSGKPFGNNRLQRLKFANFLTSLLNNYSNGFVLAVNGAWGTGKTVFLHQWKQLLEDNDYRATIFNAWDNDYFEEPTLAILSQFSDFFCESKPLPQKAISWWKTIQDVPSVALRGYLKKQASDIIGDDAVKQISDSFTASNESDLQYRNGDIAKYISSRIKFVKYQNALIKFAEEIYQAEGKPLVFIIDELDRCTPSYAVEVLEKIKHLFNIPNIIFCIAVDKEQLKRSIQGHFGSFQFNGEEYLRRFFDIELDLPPIPYLEFADILTAHFQFDKYIYSSDNRLDFIRTSMEMAEKQGLTLRQVEKFFSHAKLVFASYDRMDKSEWLVGLMLILYKFTNELFQNIVNRKITIKDVAGLLKPILDFSEYGRGPNKLGCFLYYLESYLNVGQYIQVPDDFKFDWTYDFTDNELEKMSYCYKAASHERGLLPLKDIIDRICFIQQFVSRP